MADAGYDVADYRDIDPIFGDLAEAEALIARRARRTVCGSSSTSSPTTAPTSTRGSRPRWRRRTRPSGSGSGSCPGRGDDGELPPNDWQSYFGGPAWTRVDRRPGWYLHMFTPRAARPELGEPGGAGRVRGHPAVLARPGRRRLPHRRRARADQGGRPAGRRRRPGPRPTCPTRIGRRSTTSTGPGVAFSTRTTASASSSVRSGCRRPAQFTDYLRPDELHSAFNFEFLCCAWEPEAMRDGHRRHARHARRRRRAADLGAVQPRHDPARHPLRPRRHLVRHGQQAPRRADRPRPRHPPGPGGGAADPGPARRRLRLPGRRARPGRGRGHPGRRCSRTRPGTGPATPTAAATAAAYRCRGAATQPPFGFSAGRRAEPWLPQPAAWKGATVEIQAADGESMLSLYRRALRWRRALHSQFGPDLEWLELGAAVLAFRRGGFACVVNLGSDPIRLPAHDDVVLASDVVTDGRLSADSTAWLRIPH